MDGNFTLFTSGNGGVSGSDQYVQDVFEDVSLPASNNLGLTNNSNTNPLGQYFANTDQPQFGIKNLFVQDLVLIQDRTKWVNNKPTYQVIFTETYPSIFAYVWGNIRLLNQQFGLTIDIRDIGDGFGISGLVQNVMWGFNESFASSASVQTYTDQIIGNFLAFNNSANGNPAVNTWNYQKHQSALATSDLHDFRIQALQYGTLSIGSVQVYSQNATSNLQFNPGVTYVDKTQSLTTSAVGATLSVLVGKLGGDTLAYKTIANQYALSTQESNYVSTIGVGASGGHLIDTSVGQGQSFPIGTGVIGVMGTSFYIGSVTNQSTDVLTVTPTLTFGISGLLYKAWAAGSTLAIGSTLYTSKTVIDIAVQNNFLDANGFIKSATGNYYFSDAHGSYRLWGLDLAKSQIEGYPGLAFYGNTNAFLQLDFKGSALDCVMAGNGIMHGTFYINGVAAFGMNQGLTGVVKQTIMTDSGPGWKSMVFVPGQSFINAQFINFEIYKNTNLGQSLGILGEFEEPMSKAYQYAPNATIMSLGPFQRVFADNLYLSGGWIRGLTTTQAGGVFYAGSTNSCNFNFQWFGNDFALIGLFGLSSGTSQIITLDGASIGLQANQLFQVPGTTFHSLSFQSQSNTCIISAIDFSGPSFMSIVNEQNYLPESQLANIPKAYYQSDTPRDAISGSIWAKDVNTGIAYLRIGNRWLQLSVAATFDDPNAIEAVLIKSHGTNTVNSFSDVATAEEFNFSSWVALASDVTPSTNMQYGSAFLGGNHYAIDGSNSGGSAQSLNSIFNKIAWSVGTNRTTARARGSIAPFLGNLTVAKGSNSGIIDTFNGASWVNTAATLGSATSGCAAAVQGGLFMAVGGNGTNAVNAWNGSAVSTLTNYPTPHCATVGAISNGGNAIFGGNSSGDTNSYQWSGSWSSGITMTYAPKQTSDATDNTGCAASGFNIANNMSYIAGGDSSSTVTTNASASFNGTSWAATTSSAISVANGMGAVF